MTHSLRTFPRIILPVFLALGPLAWCQDRSATAATSVASFHRALPQTRKSFSVSVAGAGRPIILIPGLECSGEVWSSAIDYYKSQYQLHVITLAGFAGQPAISGLRLADVKEDIIQYIRDNKLEHVILIGHSLGGFLAFWIGAGAPDLVDRIVAVDGVPFLPALFDSSATAAESQPNAEQMRAMYASLQPEQLKTMARMALKQMITDPKYVEEATDWAGRSDSAFVGQALYDLMTTDLRPELGRLHAPVLLIGAGKAFNSSASRLEEMRTAYENQVKNVLDRKILMAQKALHFIMFDPEFLFRSIDEFLAGRR